MTKFIDIKRKSLSLFNQIIFSYNRWCHRLHLGSTQYKQFPLKKKCKEKERKEVENRRRRKRDGKSLFKRKGKGKGENEMWKKR